MAAHKAAADPSIFQHHRDGNLMLQRFSNLSLHFTVVPNYGPPALRLCKRQRRSATKN